MSKLLTGRTYVIMGVANKWSIAWGIAQALHREGARLVFTYRERRKKNIENLASTLERQDSIFIPCDVAYEEQITELFTELKEQVGVIHGVAHCVAYANAEELAGEYVNTSREGYHLAQDISAYSLVAVARAARPLMTEGGSIITLTYLGGERVVQNYNVMGVAKAALDASMRYLAADLGKDGIRVNGISAGPIRTVSAKGVSGFNSILHTIEERAPLRRNITQEEVGNTGLFLLSDLSSGITGEIIHVDSGYHILG